MKTTDRFHLQRKSELQKVVAEPVLTKIWRKIVKQQMRKMDLLDLHDYYDFNYNIEERARHISNRVLSGRYKCHSPLIYRLEKRLGVSRHMILPNPSDALLLQAIVESVGDNIRAAEKTGKAYYSRDKHNMKLPHETYIDGGYAIHWSEKWKSFQKDIFDFTESHDYLVVTDLTNYFDSIGLRELRHIISSHAEANEVTLDLLFNLIEQLSWSPDYLPTSLKGLPTIALEAPRLLAHSMLFEIDDILNTKTNGSFVRWMDDINFGVDSVDEACMTLGSVNDVLKSRGLALNLGKTAIYNASEAQDHFMVKENIFLDTIDQRRENGESKGILSTELYRAFKIHLKNNSNLHNSGKINKRYLTIASRLKTTRLLKPAATFFKKQPGIRSNVSYYIQNLGPTKRTKKLVIELMTTTSFYDDISLFYLVKTIVAWNLKRDDADKKFVKEIYNILSKPKTVFEMYCFLWFAAKYGKPNQILNIILSKGTLWKSEPFLARQVVAIIPRIRHFKPDIAEKILSEQASSGLDDASSVANNIYKLERIDTLEKRITMYVFPDNAPKIYPIYKFLIFLSLLESKKIRDNSDFKKHTGLAIRDPWMKRWIKKHKEYY